MKAGLIVLLLACLSLVGQGIHAATKSKSRSKSGGGGFRLVLQGGLSNQGFSIPKGADFSSIRQSYYAISLQKIWPIFTLGLQYQSVGPADLNSFWLDDTTEGRYKIGFARLQFFAGFKTERAQFLAIFGSESSSWSGSPELGLKSKANSHGGFMYSYDTFSMPKFKVPLVVMVLGHPERKYEFASYPNSTIRAASGVEISVGVGLGFGF